MPLFFEGWADSYTVWRDERRTESLGHTALCPDGIVRFFEKQLDPIVHALSPSEMREIADKLEEIRTGKGKRQAIVFCNVACSE